MKGQSGLPDDKSRRRILRSFAGASVAALLPASLLASPRTTLRAQRLAWAGIRLQLPDATLFIDPLVNRDAWGEALPDTLISVDDTEGDTSVLITHSHSDHFDIGAARSALRRGGVLAHPAGIPPLSLPDGIHARPSPLWEPQLLGDFTATPVPAADGYGDTQVSWVVTAGGRRIFHGGDTLWHGNWWRIGRQFGPFDAAFLPVNGARFGWRKPVSNQPGVLTPEQAVAAADILGARVLVPIHYGVTGMKEYVEVSDPIGELNRTARKRSIHIQELAPGEWMEWVS
jgi:L-ascorbate metabolism protein UlaG (beta-lactamase superfamily)